jgi:amino acid transporter
VLGPSHQGLADNKVFALAASILLLAVLVVLTVIGLGVGKWINNIGAIGTGVAAAVLIGLGIVVAAHQGSSLSNVSFSVPGNPRFLLNSFGVICFGLVGLELASVMGDEIHEPRKTLPGAVALGGVISGVLYIAVTLTLLVAVGHKDISVLQGIVQAVSHLAAEAGIAWIVAPFSLMLSLAIAGIGSAWLAGSARIPFVAGLDSYLPDWLGRVHPKYATPYAALIVHAVVSMLLVLMNFAGTGVQETFQTMLSLAVVLQLIPFLYMFGALLRFALRYQPGQGVYSRSTLFLSGTSGLLTTALGILLVFFPSQTITSLKIYEIKMMGGTAFFVGLAWFFFFVYGRRKVLRRAPNAASIRV